MSLTHAAAPDSQSTIEPSSFTNRSLVHFDELDPMHMLHNSRFAAHVERATIALYSSLGWTWQRDVRSNPDQFHVVRDFRIEFLAPVGPGPLEIEIWVERLGNSSCVYGFRCTSKDGSVLHARGIRVIVKLDPADHTPVPWTETFREGHRELLRPLPSTV